MNQRLETDVLAELVGRKLRVLSQLRDLTLRQRALIEADDMKTLLRVFTAKQKLLEEIQRIDGRLEPFRPQDPERRVWRSPEDRRRCRSAAEACQRLVEEMKATELHDKEQLLQRRATLSQQLENAGASAAARSAYQESTSAGRLDLSSES